MKTALYDRLTVTKLSDEIHDKLAAIALAKGLSLSAYIRMLVIEAIKENK